MTRAKLIEAQYRGWCRGCGAAIDQGDAIYYDGTDGDGSRTWHQDCLVDGDLRGAE